MIDKDNRCQGCGAPIRGRACDYCGRVFDVEYGYATGNVMYADGVPLVVETTKSKIDRLQYQASQERQTAILLDNLRKSNNVWHMQTFNVANRNCMGDCGGN